MSLIHYRWVKWIALPMYLASIFFVILTYTHYGEQHGGAKCWLRIPRVGTFEPSQMAVIAGILTVGLFLSQFRKLHPALKILCIGAIVGGPMLLILKQPDMGMTIVWCPVIVAMLFVSRDSETLHHRDPPPGHHRHAAGDQFLAEAVPARADRFLHRYRYRPARYRLGDQPIADCGRLGRI